MADNTQSSSGDTIRTLEDGGGVKWGTNVFAHATTVGTPDVLDVPVAAALGDATTNPTVLTFGAAGFVYNGTTWDRLRGDTTNGVLADVTRMPGTAASAGALPAVQVVIAGYDSTGTATRPWEMTSDGYGIVHVNNLTSITDGDRSQVLYDGTTIVQVKHAVINAAASGNNTLVAAVTAKKIRVVSLFLVAAGTVNATFQDGAGGTALSGAIPLVANSGFTLPRNQDGWFNDTTANTLLNLNLSAAVQVSGTMSYIEAV